MSEPKRTRKPPAKPKQDSPKLPAVATPTDADAVAHKGHKYIITGGVLTIPGVGRRTPLEAMADTTAYPRLGNRTILEYLIANNSTTLKKIPQ